MNRFQSFTNVICCVLASEVVKRIKGPGDFQEYSLQPAVKLGLHASMTVTPHIASGGGPTKREANNVFLFCMYSSLCRTSLSTLDNLVVLLLQSMWKMHDKESRI